MDDLGLIRPVLFVPPSMLASDLMGRMQATRTQMALVIDEYGGTDGLASLEDIVEMVVGDIEDEHDDDEPMITQAGDGVFIVDGKAEIDDVAKMIGGEFAAGEHGESVDTIGGMIFNTLGRVPARGEVVQAIPGFEFHVLDADPRRVKRVRIVHSLKAERRRRAARTEQA
jgi:CBS domain containing-hemolysin-like protein